MAKRLILIGKSGSGKTTLVNAMNQNKACAVKTQALCFYDRFIDTPGEYLELRNLYNALIVTSADADVIGLVQACGDLEMRIPPSFASLFAKDVIGIVSKMDLARDPNDLIRARDILMDAGVGRIFEISAVSGEGLSALALFLNQQGGKAVI